MLETPPFFFSGRLLPSLAYLAAPPSFSCFDGQWNVERFLNTFRRLLFPIDPCLSVFFESFSNPKLSLYCAKKGSQQPLLKTFPPIADAVMYFLRFFSSRSLPFFKPLLFKGSPFFSLDQSKT